MGITWNNYGSNGWWTKDGYDSHSTEIEVDLLGGAQCFDASQTYHLWYAEDVHDASESDNHGTAYTDVYIKLACALGYYPAEGSEECTACGNIDNCLATTCTSASDVQCTECAAGYLLSGDGTCSGEGDWMKIGDAVAWGARDNSYGTLQVASSVCATEVRFVYVSGYVSCNTADGAEFGCGGSDWIAIHLSDSNEATGNERTIAPASDDASI